MVKNERYQLELFNQPKDTLQTKNQDNFLLLGYIRNYEKIILFVICFIITGIISFSLGVEKGKKYYDFVEKQKKIIYTPLTTEIAPQNTKENIIPKEEKTRSHPDIDRREDRQTSANSTRGTFLQTAARSDDAGVLAGALRQGRTTQPQEAKMSSLPMRSFGIGANNYTIQIASFKNKDSARKEAETLRKSGFTTLILHRGNYNVVCVGNFETQEKAGSLLTEIRKKYRDGFIRRL